MENKIIKRHENAKETSGGNRYHLFDEKTLNSYLYGNSEVRAIDVQKLKRKAEGEKGMKFKYKPLRPFRHLFKKFSTYLIDI